MLLEAKVSFVADKPKGLLGNGCPSVVYTSFINTLAITFLKPSCHNGLIINYLTTLT